MQVFDELRWDLARSRCLITLVAAVKGLMDAIRTQRYVGWVRVGKGLYRDVRRLVKYALAVLSISLHRATSSGFRSPAWINVIVIALWICLEQFMQPSIKTCACKDAG